MPWNFEEELELEIDKVFTADRMLSDYRRSFPWLTNSLGDPEAPIWFIGENPSLTQVERARDPGGGPPTEEAQWLASTGDKLFRRALVEAGLKTTPVEARGGWQCYITNAIKEPARVKDWKRRSDEVARATALRWAPVLRWQLERGRPSLVVFMGKSRVEPLVRWMADIYGLPLPETVTIPHYAYIGQRADRQLGLGPMHPERVKAYLNAIKDLRGLVD